eukprot:12247368-Ditylum_brightwellii.AAC.1
MTVPVHTRAIDGSETCTCCKYYTTIASPTPSPITTFDSYLTTIDDWDVSILDSIPFYEPIHSIDQYTAHPRTMIIIASDGSSKEEDNIMTFCWNM